MRLNREGGGVPTTQNKIFSATYYLELHSAIFFLLLPSNFLVVL